MWLPLALAVTYRAAQHFKQRSAPSLSWRADLGQESHGIRVRSLLLIGAIGSKRVFKSTGDLAGGLSTLLDWGVDVQNQILPTLCLTALGAV